MSKREWNNPDPGWAGPGCRRWRYGLGSALLLLGVAMGFGCGEARNGTKIALNGAGASFPAPVYQSWSYVFSQAHPEIPVNYQSLGSGAGVKQITEGTVDFAGTDNPLNSAKLAEVGLRQFPMLIGGVVVIVNLPGLPNAGLKLNPATLSDIFLGKIARWNDPEIQGDNPDFPLPDLPITVVRRADGSGTTAIFTDYLARVSPEWRERIGAGAAVQWPVGIGAQKNPGVCNNVAKIQGAIGYTEYTYALEAKLNMAQLQNRAGHFVAPTPAGFSAAAAHAPWNAQNGFAESLNNQPGLATYPITGVTYILIRKDCPAEKLAALKTYFDWCWNSGAPIADRLHYVTLPETVVMQVKQELAR